MAVITDRRKRHTVIISIAVFCTEVILALLAWNTYRTYATLKVALDQITEKEQIKDAFLQSYETISSSVELAVSTGTEYWRNRYREYQPKLDSILDKSLSDLDASEKSAAKRKFSDLGRLNREVMDLVESEQNEKASYLIFGRQYTATKDSTDKEIVRIERVLEGSTRPLLRSQKERALFSVFIILGVVAALLMVWVFVLHFTRKWQMDLYRSNRQIFEKSNELEVLNKSPETKVGERTADLHQKHIELQELNRKLVDNQNQLLQSEKMASIGQLAAGMAHEINNPMSFILGNLSSLRQYSGSIKQVMSMLDEVLTKRSGEASGELAATLRAMAELWRGEDISFILGDLENVINESMEGGIRVRDIVGNLKTFARLDESRLKTIDVNQAIEATVDIADGEFRDRCRITKRLDPLPALTCDPAQLNQVFLSLFMNAGQAINDRGEIVISSKVENGHIVIAFTDTGMGIAKENLPKLFTPFFTTKPVGKGVGLGLSLSHGIIKKHNGRIDVQSEPGKGSTFTVFLPTGDPSGLIPEDRG